MFVCFVWIEVLLVWTSQTLEKKRRWDFNHENEASNCFCLFVFLLRLFILDSNLKRVFSRLCWVLRVGARTWTRSPPELLQLFLFFSAWDEQHVCLHVCVHVRVSPGWDFEVVCATVAPPQMEKFWLCLPYCSPPNTRTHTHIHSGSRDDLPVPLQRDSASNFSFIQTRTAFPSSVFNPQEETGRGGGGTQGGERFFFSLPLFFSTLKNVEKFMKKRQNERKKMIIWPNYLEINWEHLGEKYNFKKKKRKKWNQFGYQSLLIDQRRSYLRAGWSWKKREINSADEQQNWLKKRKKKRRSSCDFYGNRRRVYLFF